MHGLKQDPVDVMGMMMHDDDDDYVVYDDADNFIIVIMIMAISPSVSYCRVRDNNLHLLCHSISVSFD